MMKKFLDFGFYKENWIAIIALILSVLYVKVFNISVIYENSLFENLAIIPLIVSICLCFKVKSHKTFFRTLALFLILIIAREFNYGRVIFCQIPNEPHEFYSWSHYKYGYLAHVIVGLYITFSALWAIFNKIWIDVIDIIKKVKFPVWTFLASFLLTFVQIYYERVMDNTVVEETAEFMLYCFVLALTIIYTRKLQNK